MGAPTQRRTEPTGAHKIAFPTAQRKDPGFQNESEQGKLGEGFWMTFFFYSKELECLSKQTHQYHPKSLVYLRVHSFVVHSAVLTYV